MGEEIIERLLSGLRDTRICLTRGRAEMRNGGLFDERFCGILFQHPSMLYAGLPEGDGREGEAEHPKEALIYSRINQCFLSVVFAH
jgi:hypothetical protein